MKKGTTTCLTILALLAAVEARALEDTSDPLDEYPNPKCKVQAEDVGSPGNLKKGRTAPEPTWNNRLSSLSTAVTERISRPIEATDHYFADKNHPIKKTPTSNIKLSLFSNIKRGAEKQTKISPSIDMDVKLPNIEERFRLFIESYHGDELPSQQIDAIDDNHLSIGFRKWFSHNNFSTDAGIRTKLKPSAFTRFTWHPLWEYGDLRFRPEQRFFLDSKDGLGTRTGLDVSHPVGKKGKLSSVSSAKWTIKREYFSWEQSFRLGLSEPVDPMSHGIKDYGWGGSKRAQGIQFSVFGEDSLTTGYRIMLGYRAPIIEPWIFWEIDPGVEWQREYDFDSTYRLILRVDLYMWGDNSCR